MKNLSSCIRLLVFVVMALCFGVAVNGFSPLQAFQSCRWPKTANSFFISSPLIDHHSTSTSTSIGGNGNSNSNGILVSLFEDLDIDTDTATATAVVDNRPHEQRATAPRTARRLNHGFKHLYRHDIPTHIQSMKMTPLEYLHEYVGYSQEEIMAMNATFPPLLTLSVTRQLHPKWRFLQETMQQQASYYSSSSSSSSSSLSNSSTHLKDILLATPQFWGARLERILAPRHAFLVYCNLTNYYGSSLIQDRTKWQLFLQACRKPKMFAALCQTWRMQQQQQQQQQQLPPIINVKMVEAFDALFGRGLMAAARNELVQVNNTWPLDYINITAAQMMDLLIQHGANPRQLDHRGVSLLHWAAGTGHVDAIAVLLRHYEQERRHFKNDEESSQLPEGTNNNNNNNNIEDERVGKEDPFSIPVLARTVRDGATPLHWAAAGVQGRAFGSGGHVHVCQYLLDQVVVAAAAAAPWLSSSSSSSPSQQRKKRYVNMLTKDGNSALMWAAWSGTLDTVKLLVRHRADTTHENRNGCTVAHWAASGGNVQVCRYLHETVGVDFTVPNYGGNTPLTHAVAFGRTKVVEWLRESVLKGQMENDAMAYSLAKDFVQWENGDERRQQVLQLFQDWYLFEEDANNNNDSIGDDDEDGDDLY